MISFIISFIASFLSYIDSLSYSLHSLIDFRTHPQQVPRYVSLQVAVLRPPPLPLVLVPAAQHSDRIPALEAHLVPRLTLVLIHAVHHTAVHDA